MAARIKTILDILGFKIYPKTKTKAIYDDNNNRLDVILTNYITKNVDDLTNYYTKEQINAIVAAVYKPGGSYAFADRPALNSDHMGFVYNITDAFTTTNEFKEGSGKNYPEGTNIVVINDGTTESPIYKYDILSGFVDLSGYQQKNLNTTIGTYTTVENALTGMNTDINTLKGQVADVDGGGTAKSIINPSAEEISNFDNGSIWIETTT